MTPFSLAVVVYEPGAAADERLALAVALCCARGVAVTGLVQRNDGDCALPGFAMALEDVATGQRIAITIAGPVNTPGCMLDTGGLAEAAATLAVARHRDSDLVVVNKFGRQEILGRGLRDEIAALLAEGLPVLTSVRRDFLPAFAAFAGPDWAEITPEAEAIMGWLQSLRQPVEG